ncbi:MAG TPA: Ldh family oxidoreductase [Solirubrobacterales bacterium]|nr:Ldh family oxidoreductase [Solirubrobacterales bacterium]
MEIAVDQVVVPVDVVRARVVEVLSRHGAKPLDAEVTADLLLRADLREQPSHGLLRLRTICERLDAGLINPDYELDVSSPTESLLLVDGDRGFGHVVAWKVTELMLETVARTGICLASVTNANHIGMAGIYVEHAARVGKVMLAMTYGESMVRPYGGVEPLLGTNPIAIGVPADPEPFVLDMSTSASSIGRLIEHREAGLPIPEGWAVDAEGRPTTDPGAGMEGGINPFGGAKGYGLGLAIALLAGGLTGSAMGTTVTGTLDATDLCNKGDLFVMIAPSFFPDGDAFARRVSAYLDEIRASRPVAGTDKVLVPGDRGRASEDAARADGLRLRSSLWEEVKLL